MSGTASPVTSTPRDASVIWEELAGRPLKLPTIGPTADCPVSIERTYRPFDGAQSFLVLGDGPAYPSIRARAAFDAPAAWVAGDGRRFHKGLWLLDASYTGPVLARGRDLRGTDEIHWDDGRPTPPSQLRIDATPTLLFTPAPHHRDRPSSWSVLSRGCYGIQIDGIGLSYQLVFEVR
jgi:hypothetical protein